MFVGEQIRNPTISIIQHWYIFWEWTINTHSWISLKAGVWFINKPPYLQYAVATLEIKWKLRTLKTSLQRASLQLFKSKFVCLPTDAQLNCLKNNFKIYIKFDIDSEQFTVYTDKERITYAATLPNYPHQCILIDYFNKCNFSKIELCALWWWRLPRNMSELF